MAHMICNRNDMFYIYDIKMILNECDNIYIIYIYNNIYYIYNKININ